MFLPPEVRRNDWWPDALTQSWLEARRRSAASAAPAAPAAPASHAVNQIIAAMAEQSADPFQGAVQRHVMPEGMSSADMEVEAAKMALAQFGRSAQSVDLLLTHTVLVDELLSNQACILHDRLALPTSCLSMQVDASAYSFLGQMAIAEAMILAGRARHALLVQSCAASRLLDHRSPISPLFGDGATAVIMGEVNSGSGIMAAAHRTDGASPRTLVASVPGMRWYDDGRPVIHVADPVASREMFLSTVDRGKEVVAEALAAAGVMASEIEYFGVHQGTPWLARIASECFGLTSAKRAEVFTRTGYLFSASIPLGLCIAEQQSMIRPGALVLLFGGGTGMTYGATVLRWRSS